MGASSPRKFWIFRPSETVSEHYLGKKIAPVLFFSHLKQVHRKREWLGVARYTAAVVVTLALVSQSQTWLCETTLASLLQHQVCTATLHALKLRIPYLSMHALWWCELYRKFTKSQRRDVRSGLSYS